MTNQTRNFAWYLFLFGFKSLLPLLVLPIFTNYISVKDFGLYALSIFYGVFGAGIINLGLSSVFERNFFEFYPNKRKEVMFSILVFVLLNYIILSFLTFYFSEKISNTIFQQIELKDLLSISLTFQTFKSFNQYFLTYLKNYENAKNYSYLSILESVLSNGIALILVVYASMGVYGFILGQSVGVLVVFSITFVYLFFPFYNRFDVASLKSQLSLSLPLTPRIFFGVINTQFDRYMLGLLGTIGGVGIYDIGQKLANTTFTFMTAVQNVFSPQVYKRFFSDDLNMRKSIGVYLTPFFYLSVFICMVVGVFSHEILFLLTPVEFHEAAPIVSILCLLYGFYFFGKQPQLLFAKKTALISLLSLIAVGLNIGLNMPLIHYYGTTGAACATTIAGVISTAISFYYGQKYAPIKYEKKVYFILLYFVFSILTTLYMMNIDIDYKLLLFFKLVVLIIYLIIGWISEIFNFNMIKQIVRLKSLN